MSLDLVGGTDFAVLIVVATVLCSLAVRLKQPIVVAYILSGLVAFHLGLLQDPAFLRSLTGLAVAFLVFVIGMELSFRQMASVRGIVLGGTILFCLVLGGLAFAVLSLLGLSVWESAYLGLIFSFGSTVLVVRILSERNQVTTVAGRILVGSLVMQDLILIAALSIFALVSGGIPSTALGDLLTAKGWGSFASWSLLLGLVLLLAFAWAVSRFVVRPFFGFASRSPELLVVSSLGLLFGFSIIASDLGFSVAIGAFVAGLVVANSEHNVEVLARIKPLATVFGVLFFAALGFSVSFTGVGEFLVPLLVLVVLTVIGKPLLVTVGVRLFGYRPRTAAFVGIHSGQISAFSLLLIADGVRMGLLRDGIVTLTVFWLVIAFVLSSYIIGSSDSILGSLSRRFPSFRQEDEEEASQTALAPSCLIVSGGTVDTDLVDDLHRRFPSLVAMDPSPEAVQSLRNRGREAFVGTVSGPAALARFDLGRLEFALTTAEDLEHDLAFVSEIRRRVPSATIVALARDDAEASLLYREGATYVVLFSSQVEASLVSTGTMGLGAYRRRHVALLQRLVARDRRSAVRDIDDVLASVERQIRR